LKAAENNTQHETTKPATTVGTTSNELKDKKNKLIQKEAVETGSVS
jgi:hypothetical protein